jgi:hypothetical protein
MKSELSSSPFGEVCGLAARGTEQTGLRKVLFAVTLSIDEGASALPMRLAADTPQKEIAWEGVSNVVYVAVLRNGNPVRASFTCVHRSSSAEGDDGDGHSLEICTALTFHPHGWVRFARTTLLLNRYDVLRFDIPLDIVDKSMFRSHVAVADLERLYGLSLTDATASNGSSNGNGLSSFVKARKNRIFPSFALVHNESQRKETRLIEDHLEPAWRERVTSLAASLLRHPQRTRTIIRKWHSRPMFKDKNPCQTWALFIETLLNSPCQMRITQNALHLFKDPALAIPLTWLSTEERMVFTDIVIDRAALFRHVSRTPDQHYACSGFRLDGLLSKVICPRYVVHQFVLDCVTRALLPGRERPTLLLTTVEAVGICHVHNRRDPFLYFLKRALEHRTVLNDVAQLPLYIRIGDAVPLYAYQPPDRSKPQRQPCWTPK